MPRKLLSILFSICVTCSYAQVKYKKCTVYSTNPSSGLDSFVSKVLLYNKFGKITEEHIYQRKEMPPGYIAEPDEVTLYAYTKDTLLSLKRTICLGGHDLCLNDTVLAIYSYDEKNKISGVLSASYGRGGTGCMVGIAGTRWYDSTKTTFSYNENGNLLTETTSNISLNMPTGFTIGFQSNFRSYAYDHDNRLISIRRLHVKTLEYFEREFIEENGYADTTEVAREVFNYYDGCYTVDLFTTNFNGKTHTVSYVFHDRFNRVIQEYIGDSYLAGTYLEGPIERFYSYQPDKRLINEILYDEKGRVEQVNSYIYE